MNNIELENLDGLFRKSREIVQAANKTLEAQLYGEFKEFFLENAVEYFVS